MPVFIDRPSPNFDERDPTAPLQYVILHYTGMPTRDEALERLCDPVAKVSAHYLIDEDGAVFRLVDESKRAWHAGKSFWKGLTNLNSASIGIELVNPGHEFGYRAFPAPQIAALKLLLSDIFVRHRLNAEFCLLGHSDIAPTRKTDPGELFPWQELAAAGFGVWPETVDTQLSHSPQKLLELIGYDVSEPEAALLAFQRRYDPAHLTGRPEASTMQRLAALAALSR